VNRRTSPSEGELAEVVEDMLSLDVSACPDRGYTEFRYAGATQAG
jgi:hypothetical protein